MTELRKNAMALLERMPEDKLYFIIPVSYTHLRSREYPGGQCVM